MLLTTHYLDEAQELADRVAIVKGGQILAEGSPAELGVGGGSRYRVAYVRDGEPVIHQTDDPTSLLHELTAGALARGRALEGLSVTRPSLEEIYLELTPMADDARRCSGASTASSVTCSGATRARPSSTSCCR